MPFLSKDTHGHVLRTSFRNMQLFHPTYPLVLEVGRLEDNLVCNRYLVYL